MEKLETNQQVLCNLIHDTLDIPHVLELKVKTSFENKTSSSMTESLINILHSPIEETKSQNRNSLNIDYSATTPPIATTLETEFEGEFIHNRELDFVVENYESEEKSITICE